MTDQQINEEAWRLYPNTNSATHRYNFRLGAKWVLSQSQWIPVTERLPEPQLPVSAYGINTFGKGRTIKAKWIPKFNKEEEGDYDGDADYDEENDIFYWPEGWYEWNECEDMHFKVDFPITHWQPLPEPPKTETK